MSKRLRESVFSKTEPKDTNVVWYQPTEEGIKEKVYNGGWEEVGGSGGGSSSETVENAIKITYSKLKSLKDNSQLTPGSFYRITDYVTTTTQPNTKSANHPFDVIILALSENTLCEDAKAILHEGDTYFADNDLSAWELKYCLDNDETRFAWADVTNGKGVIYRMVDEKRNDCPYDFKNILFYNTTLTSGTTSDKYYYTFSYVVSKRLYDGTTEKQVKSCYGNKMGEYNDLGLLRLNENVFKNAYFSSPCVNNTFGSKCISNTFGDGCNNNTFGNNLQNCSLDSDKTSITLNEEYYDDGSGQLVPTKHPDLSTQPSILPYKFMGQYVYEQLIPVNKGDRFVNNKFAVEIPMIISAGMFGVNSFKNINILAAKSNILLLDTSSETNGYINVKYTDGSVLEPSDDYYYGSAYTQPSNNFPIDFGIMDDETVYIYDNDILTLSKNGTISDNSIPTQYKNSSKIIIDNNVTSIASYTFSNLTSLTSIDIPNSLTGGFGPGVFDGCTGLTSITCRLVNPPLLNGSIFEGVNKSIPLYVPSGSVVEYRSADYWKEFTNIQNIRK